MKNMSVAPYVAWCTLLSGLIGLVGFIFLLLFYTIEVPAMLEQGQLTADPQTFGTLNDASYIFVALFLLPGALELYRATRSKAPALSQFGLVLGVVGLLAMAVSQVLFVPRLIPTEQAAALQTISAGVVGVWLLLVCITGRSTGTLPGGLVWLGIASGVGMVLLPVTYFFAGTPQASTLQAEMPGVPAIIGFGLGILSQVIGWPVWTTGLGRFFMSHRY